MPPSSESPDTIGLGVVFCPLATAWLLNPTGSRLDLDEGPIDDDEATRHVGTVDCQTPQSKPIGGLVDLVRLTSRLRIVIRFIDADRPGELVVADAARLAGGREVRHVVYCTRERYRRQEGKELDGATLV
jgi:hypothetical protein